MSVDIPVFNTKTRTADANDIYSYGFAFTSSDLDGAVKSLADILPDMLKLAETEKACQLMAGDREDKTSCKCAGACDNSGGSGDNQIHHDEAGREREKLSDPSDESKRYDA